jgi:hypothetical protein
MAYVSFRCVCHDCSAVSVDKILSAGNLSRSVTVAMYSDGTAYDYDQVSR